MISNYELQQYFLDQIKEFAISNPYQEIDSDFIYSNLIGFNIKNSQCPYHDISYNYNDWIERYKNNPDIKVFTTESRKHFLWYIKGKTLGNEIKLYIPLDKEHIKEGANQLFDFISSTKMNHQSKIADIIRNDNIVIRVDTLEDAQTIIDYINNNMYLKEGMIRVNPFLPSCNGVGITMDNTYSYNSTVCKIISEFLNYLKQNNRLDLFTVNELNKYIKFNINNIKDPDLKDIYVLISKTTTPNFKLEDFLNHANYKLVDEYTSDRKKIIDPKFYFEKAIKINSEVHPENKKESIIQFLKGNPNYFTSQQKARRGLIKYVHPGDVINLMRTKLNENNVQVPNSDNELIDKYLDILLNKELNRKTDESFDIIKNAYINTLNVYNKAQSRFALKELFLNNELKYFTNQYKDRDKLKNLILEKNARNIILNGIDINNLDINNIDEIINRFENSIGINDKNKQNTY